jgi:hypothetical protein
MNSKTTPAAAAVAAETPAKEAQVTVELQKPHTHERKALEPGERITVREGLAKWLIEQGIGKAVNG